MTLSGGYPTTILMINDMLILVLNGLEYYFYNRCKKFKFDPKKVLVE